MPQHSIPTLQLDVVLSLDRHSSRSGRRRHPVLLVAQDDDRRCQRRHGDDRRHDSWQLARRPHSPPCLTSYLFDLASYPALTLVNRIPSRVYRITVWNSSVLELGDVKCDVSVEGATFGTVYTYIKTSMFNTSKTFCNITSLLQIIIVTWGTFSTVPPQCYSDIFQLTVSTWRVMETSIA